MSKYTPGPWNLVQHNEKDSRVGRKTLLAIVYSEAFRDRENQEANARLIATAPDLLEACRLAKKHLEPDLIEPGRSVFWALVAAIAKAEGAAHD